MSTPSHSSPPQLPSSAPTAAMTDRPRRPWLRWVVAVIGLLIASGFMVMIIRSVDMAAVGAAVAAAHPGWLLLGLASLAVGYGLRIVRWRWLLMPANPAVSLRACAVPLLGGFALNNLLPARAGDVVRVVAFQDRLGAGIAATAGSVMVERILDLLVLIAALMIGLAVVPHDRLPAGMVQIGGWLGASILIAGIAGLLGAAWIRPMLERYAQHDPSRKQKASLAQRVAVVAARVLLGMDLIRDPRRLALIASCSVLVWIGEFGLYVCVERSLSTAAGTPGALLAMASGNLATLIPGTPGHVGTFHYFAAIALEAAGAARDSAVAFAILTHLLFWAATTVIGLIALATAGWCRSGRTTPVAPPSYSPSTPSSS